MLHPRELLWRSKFHIFLSSLWHQDLLGQEVSPGFLSLLDNFMGGLGMKQVSLAASCIPGEAKHLLAHSYSSTEVPDQKDLLWHWVCSVGIEGTWVKCNCSSYSFQCVQCWLYYAPVSGLSFFVRSLDFHKGALNHELLSKVLLFEEKVWENTYFIILRMYFFIH